MTYKRLTSQDRDGISAGLVAKQSLRSIAKSLNRSPSTISREISRYKHKTTEYRPIFCHNKAAKQASSRRSGKRKLILNKKLKELVFEMLNLRWSPEQIEMHLKLYYKSDMQISKEAIYTYIFVFMRRHMREEFTKLLRSQKKQRARRKPQQERNPNHSQVLGEIELIDERPAEALDRLIPGHWEGDLIIGGAKEQTALGTLVERTTRFAVLVPLANKSAEEVRTQFAKVINQLPKHLKRSLTYDQGSEMTQHKLFTVQTEMKVYFAHPRSPWERGTNENTNGLIRQFFPKSTNFKNVTQEEIRKVQDMLNDRPRKTLEWATPAEKMRQLLQ